jgi:hypothetical protein
MAQEKARDLLVIEWHLQKIAIKALVRSRPVAMSARSKTIFIYSISLPHVCCDGGRKLRAFACQDWR